MSKRFRVLFCLEGDEAEAFGKVECKSHVVAAALELYFSLGSTMRGFESRLDAIQDQLDRGSVCAPAKTSGAEDDTEKKIDLLIGKTLGL